MPAPQNWPMTVAAAAPVVPVQGLAAVAEDEDGVENDVHDSADQLAHHAQMGAAGGGQQLLAHGLGTVAEAEHAAELQILDALPGDVHVRSLCVEVAWFRQVRPMTRKTA